jgi:hypothetical protein
MTTIYLNVLYFLFLLISQVRVKTLQAIRLCCRPAFIIDHDTDLMEFCMAKSLQSEFSPRPTDTKLGQLVVKVHNKFCRASLISGHIDPICRMLYMKLKSNYTSHLRREGEYFHYTKKKKIVA